MNASHPGTVRSAKRVARALGMNDAQYRKTLSALRARIAILENSLRERAYTFDYAKQPSKAMFRYRKAFLRNDGPRYRAYLAQVAARQSRAAYRDAAILTSWWPRCWTAFPPRASGAALDAAWKALPDYTGDEDALVVVDGSGSTHWHGLSAMPAARCGGPCPGGSHFRPAEH